MENKDYLKDIQEIKSMMSKSTQFISLSGLSGVLAGIYALIGAWFANIFMSAFKRNSFEVNRNSYIPNEDEITRNLFIIAITVLILSIATAYFFTKRKAAKNNEKIWDVSSKRMMANFSIPLLTGGIFAILLLKNQYYGLIAPITLIFYGLACVNASKYTLRDVRYLGFTEIILGLIAVEFSGYGLIFWALGFGVCHILYGSIMYFKYERL